MESRPACIHSAESVEWCSAYHRILRALPLRLQDNWADGQGKEVYVRNYYSTKAFFDKLPGEQF